MNEPDDAGLYHDRPHIETGQVRAAQAVRHHDACMCPTCLRIVVHAERLAARNAARLAAIREVEEWAKKARRKNKRHGYHDEYEYVDAVLVDDLLAKLDEMSKERG